jgi:hypothetical protein
MTDKEDARCSDLGIDRIQTGEDELIGIGSQPVFGRSRYFLCDQVDP